MHILIIDDEIRVTNNLTMYLKCHNHTCMELTGTSTEELLHAYLRQNSPEAVILDFGMLPRGDVIYGWIKNWEQASQKTTKIIFYTNYAESTAEHQHMITAGATTDEIILKREVGSDVVKILRVLS